MKHERRRHDDRVILNAGEHSVVVAWHRNRFHYHPRIFRLTFDGFERLPPALLVPYVVDALDEVRAATRPEAPLLFRTTIATRSRLLPPLRRCGFLETRRVYEPILPLDTPLPNRPSAADPTVHSKFLNFESLDLERRDRLLEVFTEIYARTSRLDPATPERLDHGDMWMAFTDGLDFDLSTCALLGDTVVGTCTIYRGDDLEEVELGPFGVTTPHLPAHREITLAMLRRSILRARANGVRRLRAEIDSDDPWTLYTCAELPFVRDAESVSLALLPAWQT